jgi:hypothetical protein
VLAWAVLGEHGGGVNLANGGLERATHDRVVGIHDGEVANGVLEGVIRGGGPWGGGGG